MHDEHKRKMNYAPWAIAAGALLVLLSILLRNPGGTNTTTPVADNQSKAGAGGDKEVIKVSEDMVKAMMEAAITENPALRENIDMLEKEIRKGVIEQEMMVAEAIDRGLASSDPIARNRLRELIILGIYQEADIGMTPEAMRDYYEKNRDKYFIPEMRKVRHLFVRVTNVTHSDKARETLDKLFKEATGPESKRSEAVEKAIAPVWITESEVRSSFGPSFAERMFSEPVGDWSGPIESTSGWHRIQVLEVAPARYRDYEEVEAEVEADLRTQLRHDAYLREMKRLNDKFDVKIIP